MLRPKARFSRFSWLSNRQIIFEFLVSSFELAQADRLSWE